MDHEELLSVLLGLTCLLVGVTVVGHGIWLLLATIFRTITGASSPRPPTDEIRVILRVLQRLADQQRIPPETLARLNELIQSSAPALAAEPPPMPPLAATAASATAESGAAESGAPADADTDVLVVAEIVDAEVVKAAEVVRPRPVAAFAAGQTSPVAPSLHPLDRPDLPDQLAPRRASASKPLAALLQAFMEENNIRWGEIVSGLMIVVCAIGLVISLWATLRDAIPYLPALIFLAGTAAFHGAGHYTLRRWKLPSISRAILVIGTLLIPLNFLAAIALISRDEAPPSLLDPSYLAAVVVGLTAYGVMAYFAGRALTPRGAWRLSVVVIAPCLGQLVINRLFVPPPRLPEVWYLLALPVAAVAAVVADDVRRALRLKRLNVRRVEPILLTLGIGAFSAATAVGLLVGRSENLSRATALSAPAISLWAACFLAVGIVLHSRLSRPGAVAAPIGLRSVGTALAVFGAITMLISVALAWPAPELLIATSLVNVVGLTAFALLGGLPVLHYGAVASLAILTVVGWHLTRGSFVDAATGQSRAMIAALVSGESSLILTAAALAAVLLSSAFGAVRRESDRTAWLIGGGATAGLSLVVALIVGFLWGTGTSLSAPLLAAYAVGLLVGARWVDDGRAAWAGSVALVLALAQAWAFNPVVDHWLADAGGTPHRPLLLALLSHSVAAAGVFVANGLASRRPSVRPARRFADAISASALATALLAAPWVLWVWQQRYADHAGYAALFSVAWLVLAVARQWPIGLAFFQAGAYAAVAFAVAAWRMARGYWNGDWSDIRQLYCLLALAGGGAIGWCLLRSLLNGQRSRLDGGGWRMFDFERTTVDRGLLLAACIALPLIASWIVVPGAGYELDAWANLSPLSNADVSPLTGKLAWGTCLVLAAAVAAARYERPRDLQIVGWLAATFTVVPLIAARFHDTAAVASALRWGFAAQALLLACLFWFRGHLARVWRGIAGRCDLESADAIEALRLFATAISALPALGLTVVAVACAVEQIAPNGPTPASWFSQIGLARSYGVPLALVATMLLMLAVRDGRPRYALASSSVSFFLAVLASILPAVAVGEPVQTHHFVRLVHYLTATCGGFGLLWLALRRWIERDAPVIAALESNRDGFRWANSIATVHTQLMLSIVLTIVGGLLTAGIVWDHPFTSAPLELTEAGRPLAFVGVLLAVAAVAWHGRRQFAESWPHLVGWTSFALLPAAAAIAGRSASAARAAGIEVLLSGATLVSGLMIGAAVAKQRLNRESIPDRLGAEWYWSIVGGLVVVPALLFFSVHDPNGPWLSATLTALVCALAAVAAVLLRRQPLAIANVLIGGIAAAEFGFGVARTIRGTQLTWISLWAINAAALLSIAWLAADRFWQRRREEPFDPRWQWLTAHRLWAAVLIVMLPLVACWCALLSMERSPNSPWKAGEEAWLTSGLLLVGLLLFGLLWDRYARTALLALYAWGLTGIPLAVVLFRLEFPEAFVVFVVGLAVQVAVTGNIWRNGANLAGWGQRHGVFDPVGGLSNTARWLPTLSTLLSALALANALLAVLAHEDRAWRLAAGFAPLGLAWGIGSQAQQQRRDRLQLWSLLLVIAAGILVGWADIQPSHRGLNWLSRVIRALLVLAGSSLLLNVAVARRLNPLEAWQWSVKKASVIAGVAALGVLAIVLLLEANLFILDGLTGLPLTNVQLIAVAVVLLLLAVSLIAFALLPGRDPWALDEQGRMGYVYLAELLAALLFAHVYMGRPHWFSAELRQYWPYVVLAIAFAGAAVGELFQRAGLRVLAQPLQRTGAFLPLLPALGMWVAASESDYSLLLFGAGIVYLLLAISRQSTAATFAAALAGNGALWSLWTEQDFLVWRHPQLWLIPPAASVLVAAEVNRRRLPEATVAALRYASLLIIYLSSTAEMFVQGIGAQIWPPIVLLLFSLAGAVLGIVLRVRAFLFLGTGFVFLSLISMVWHASRSIEHSWPWWAFGIGAGIAVLILFGFFEKNRDKLQTLVETLKHWDA